MTRHSEARRVTVEVLVKATSQAEAREIVVGHLNEWFVSGGLIPDTAGFPVGTLLHYTVTPASGHRAVAA